MSPNTSGSPDWGEYLRALGVRLRQPEDFLLKLLEDVIAHALVSVGASGGSVLIPDAGGQHLRFLVSSGPAAAALANMKVPLEGSIAGYVYCTGQMTAVGDLTEEHPPNFYPEIGRAIGVTTRTYLALPILMGGRPRGVATFVNRPGPPPYRPFQPDEIARAVAITRVEGTVLRHLERTWQLSRLADADLATAWQALAPGEAAPPAGAAPAELSLQDTEAEPWVRVLQDFEHLSEEDQGFCADLVSFVAQRRGIV
jgi:hypothetical protein